MDMSRIHWHAEGSVTILTLEPDKTGGVALYERANYNIDFQLQVTSGINRLIGGIIGTSHI